MIRDHFQGKTSALKPGSSWPGWQDMPGFSAVSRTFQKNNASIQFWAYEGGNVVAAIAGAGGFSAFALQIRSIAARDDLSTPTVIARLIAEHGDIAVAVALGLLVIAAPPVLRIARTIAGGVMVNVAVAGLCLPALVIVLLALAGADRWITVSAAAFVLGSLFLRGCKANPFLLKAGGLSLAVGGIMLMLFGLQTFGHTLHGGAAWASLATAALTVVTGFFVTGASLLTYHAGILATAQLRRGNFSGGYGLVARIADPASGYVPLFFVRYVDPLVLRVNRVAVSPSLFWIPSETKEKKPLLTSMWARLPWRVLTGGFALAIATPEMMAFAIANLMWAVGDVAIGSMQSTQD